MKGVKEINPSHSRAQRHFWFALLERGCEAALCIADSAGQQTKYLCSFSWHRIAYSVQGKSVTLYLDCQRVETLDLLRGDAAVVSTEGVTVFGTRLLDQEVFEVGHKM